MSGVSVFSFYFNLSMSYRENAAIKISYGRFVPINNPSNNSRYVVSGALLHLAPIFPFFWFFLPNFQFKSHRSDDAKYCPSAKITSTSHPANPLQLDLTKQQLDAVINNFAINNQHLANKSQVVFSLIAAGRF